MDNFDRSQQKSRKQDQEQTQNLFIPSNMFIFDTRWFEQIGISSNKDESSKNGTQTSTKEDSSSPDDSLAENELLGNDKALVLAPPRRILRALEDKIALEQSGQFVVGSNLDSENVDILIDPMGFLPKDARIESDTSFKHASSFRRETFSKISAVFLEGTRKRQAHMLKKGEDTNNDQKIQANTEINKKVSILEGFVAFLRAIVMYIGAFEKFLQANNLFPNYKNTILLHLLGTDDENDKENIIGYHSHQLLEETSFEGSNKECDPVEMEKTHQRCIVRIE